jgi:DNA-binding PadR family transcriptional regulator
MLKAKGRSYGYDLTGEFGQYALTGTVIEKAALYRTLRCLEENGHVVSD